MALVVLARLSSLTEAMVMVSALRSADIPAEVADAYLGQTDWQLQTALGGFRVQVPGEYFADAKAFLIDLRNSIEPVPRGESAIGSVVPAWKNRLAVILMLGIPIFPLIIVILASLWS